MTYNSNPFDSFNLGQNILEGFVYIYIYMYIYIGIYVYINATCIPTWFDSISLVQFEFKWGGNYTSFLIWSSSNSLLPFLYKTSPQPSLSLSLSCSAIPNPTIPKMGFSPQLTCSLSKQSHFPLSFSYTSLLKLREFFTTKF